MQFLRANTEVIVTVGPFVDVGDGFTPQVDIALSGNEAELIKHGSTSVTDISGATWAPVTNCRGYYSLTLTAALTSDEGLMTVVVQDDSDCLPVKAEFMVLSEAAYDSLFVAKDAGFMDVNLKTLGRADSQETEVNNLETICAAYSATRGLAGTALPAVVAGAASGLPLKDASNFLSVANMPAVAAGGAGGLFIAGTNAATSITTALTANITGNLSGSVGSVTTKTGYALANTGADLILKSSTFALAVADAIWDEAVSGHVDDGSFGKTDADILVDTNDLQTNQGAWATATGFLTQANVRTAIGLASANLDTQLAALPTAAENADAAMDEAMADHVAAGSLGKAVADALADTNELQTNQGAWATAEGFSTHDAAAVKTAIEAGGSHLTLIKAITDAQAATGTGLSAIPWNAAWDAEVQSEVNDALVAVHLDHLLAVDYDPSAKPGVATALLNEIVENDGGVSRFSANALEQAPSGGDATEAKQDTIISTLATVAKTGADSDTLETLSDQLDGLEALSGEGAYTGTLTIDDGSTGLQGAVVNARLGGVLKASGTTDASGEITNWVFGANTYDLAARLAGYGPETDTIAVSADAWTKTISLTAISISAPEAAELCTVQFRVKLSGVAVSGAVCKAKLVGINTAADGVILSNEESSDTTDAEGIAELQLVQHGQIVKGSGIYALWVEIAGRPVASVECQIPNQSTCLFESLLQ